MVPSQDLHSEPGIFGEGQIEPHQAQGRLHSSPADVLLGHLTCHILHTGLATSSMIVRVAPGLVSSQPLLCNACCSWFMVGGPCRLGSCWLGLVHAGLAWFMLAWLGSCWLGSCRVGSCRVGSCRVGSCRVYVRRQSSWPCACDVTHLILYGTSFQSLSGVGQ